MTITLGKQIKNTRQSRDISQSRLAEQLKYLNQSQISKIEKGNRKATAQDLIEISKVLGVTVDELVKEKQQEGYL
jgi:transcriptional regulator with XRE-family HTH domain